MKILITGANGLLGHKLVDLLYNDPSIQLIATSKGNNRLPLGKKVEYRSMNIVDEQEVSDIILDVKPDCIIHTAAMTNVDQCELHQADCWRLNVNATQILVDAAEKCDSHFVHLSTDFIFNGKVGPLDENEVPDPVNFYGESKLASEKIVLGMRGKKAIARTVLVYGITPSLRRSNIILWVKESLEKGEIIQVVDDQFRTPTLAEDLAIGCMLIAKKGATGIYNISGKDLLTPYDMAIKTAEFFNLDKSLIKRTNSSKFSQPARRPLITGFKIDKARSDLGYEPVSFEEGIAVVAKNSG